ncbi:hypothetical protein ANCDUO_19747, partial [Ancylostoma duodenale]
MTSDRHSYSFTTHLVQNSQFTNDTNETRRFEASRKRDTKARVAVFICSLNTEFVQIGVEPDGVKLYSDTGMEFVGPVSRDERAVLGVASASDGALLYEAAQWLNTNRSHQSYEYCMQIRDLSLAIDQCISTATSAWSPEIQKELLK